MSTQDDIGIGCAAYRADITTSYGYVPSKGAGIAFCVLFGVSMVAHIVQFSLKRTWWASVFAVGCASWAARTWSSDCPYNSTAFLMQISTLIIGKPLLLLNLQNTSLPQFPRTKTNLDPPSPSPNFLHSWHLRNPWSSHPTLRPRELYPSPETLPLDLLHLRRDLPRHPSRRRRPRLRRDRLHPGTHTMVAGIVFQLASLTAFVLCAVDFLRRATRLGLLKLMARGPLAMLLGAMVLSTVVIYIRSVYRTVELAQGWHGYLITHESYFVGLDGVLMVIAVGVFNICHPGWLLPAGGDGQRHGASVEVKMLNDPEAR
ncbi:RTA1-domain-containing protein [Penicillium chermesinum]|nr:RTA1-domain-containing protein [Penicillium chermesinum]